MTRPDVGVFVSVEGQRAVTLSSDLEDDEVGRQIWEVRLAPDRALALAEELRSQAVAGWVVVPDVTDIDGEPLSLAPDSALALADELGSVIALLAETN